jgi:hypothetical protein
MAILGKKPGMQRKHTKSGAPSMELGCTAWIAETFKPLIMVLRWVPFTNMCIFVLLTAPDPENITLVLEGVLVVTALVLSFVAGAGGSFSNEECVEYQRVRTDDWTNAEWDGGGFGDLDLCGIIREWSQMSFASIFVAMFIFFFLFVFYSMTKPTSNEKVHEHASYFWTVAIIPLMIAVCCWLGGTLLYSYVWSYVLVLKQPGQTLNDGSTVYTTRIEQSVAFTTGVSYFLMLAMILLSLLITIPLFSRAITDFYEENYGGGAEDVSAWKEVLTAGGVSEETASEIGRKLLAADLTPDRVKGVIPHAGHTFVADLLKNANLTPGQSCDVVKAIGEMDSVKM